MYLNYESYSTSISDFRWKNKGALNEYIDISLDDPIFVERHMQDIDGDYYLAIQGINDCFYNLYISAQDVKIINIENNFPTGCSCESKNDYCYFRYENINNPFIREVNDQFFVSFYIEYSYGSGSIFDKLYPTGNIEDIMKNLPTLYNMDFNEDISGEFLYIQLDKNELKYTPSSVLVVGVQCKESSLFDLTATILDKKEDIKKDIKKSIFLNLNQDNLIFLSEIKE